MIDVLRDGWLNRKEMRCRCRRCCRFFCIVPSSYSSPPIISIVIIWRPFIWRTPGQQKKGNLSEYKWNGHLKKKTSSPKTDRFWWWKTNSSELSFPVIEWVSSTPNRADHSNNHWKWAHQSIHPTSIRLSEWDSNHRNDAWQTNYLPRKRSHIPDFGKGTSSSKVSAGRGIC